MKCMVECAGPTTFHIFIEYIWVHLGTLGGQALLGPCSPLRPKQVLRFLRKRLLVLGPPNDVPHSSPPAGPGVGGHSRGLRPLPPTPRKNSSRSPRGFLSNDAVTVVRIRVRVFGLRVDEKTSTGILLVSWETIRGTSWISKANERESSPAPFGFPVSNR